jgi:predicted transcriptional regulator
MADNGTGPVDDFDRALQLLAEKLREQPHPLIGAAVLDIRHYEMQRTNHAYPLLIGTD